MISQMIETSVFSDRTEFSVTTMEDDVVSMQDVFVFDKKGVSPEGHTLGTFIAAGIRPKFADKLAASGISLPANFFEHVVDVCN
jgi:pilus assembly protein CpaF